MRRDLESSRQIPTQDVAYALDDSVLPFGLCFAQRRMIIEQEQHSTPSFATQSDGQTSGNDGSGGGNEEFDWLKDD